MTISEKLKLIKGVYKITDNIPVQANIEDGFLDCFGEIRCLKCTRHIEVKDDVKSVIASMRKIPFAFTAMLKDELQRTMKFEIMEPIEKPTDWLNALVVSKPKES